MTTSVIIVGGGLAGLSCADLLHKAERDFLLIEADDRLGGRIRTDHLDGFTLDHGFQVFLTGYDETASRLDLKALDLHAFEPGSLIRWNGTFARFSDPWRRPDRLLETLFSGPGSLLDRWRIGRLRAQAAGIQKPDLSDPETTADRFDRLRFSAPFRQAFLDPWWRGVLLDPELSLPASYTLFLFRAFSRGDAVLPARGMQSLPQQLADRLPPDQIRLSARVDSLSANTVHLDTGESLHADHIVLATDPHTTARLTHTPPPRMHGTTCIYFAADHTPIDDHMLVLNSDPNGTFNHLCVPTQVCPAYGPPGAALISVSIVHPVTNPNTIVDGVRSELQSWFGTQVNSWRHLKTCNIPHALPASINTPAHSDNHPFILAGDHRVSPSIEGAMLSGRHAAQAILSED